MSSDGESENEDEQNGSGRNSEEEEDEDAVPDFDSGNEESRSDGEKSENEGNGGGEDGESESEGKWGDSEEDDHDKEEQKGVESESEIEQEKKEESVKEKGRIQLKESESPNLLLKAETAIPVEPKEEKRDRKSPKFKSLGAVKVRSSSPQGVEGNPVKINDIPKKEKPPLVPPPIRICQKTTHIFDLFTAEQEKTIEAEALFILCEMERNKFFYQNKFKRN